MLIINLGSYFPQIEGYDHRRRCIRYPDGIPDPEEYRER